MKKPDKQNFVLVNYAHNGYLKSQDECSAIALKLGGIDKVISMGFDDLSADFRKKNRVILSQERGAGWWCWKPEVILRALEKIDSDDILIYSDSGWKFKDSIHCLLPYLEHNHFILSEAIPRIEGMKSGHRTVLTDCKRYCLDYYGITPDSNEAMGVLTSGGLIMMRKSHYVISFMEKWRADMTHDLLMIDDRTDIPKPEYAEFMRHMNDMGPLNCLLALTGGFHAITREARCQFMERIWPREIDYAYVAPVRRGV